jgi:leucyl/phenylalanyl-tRNA---protein transferase
MVIAMHPVDLPPSRWDFPPAGAADADGLVAVGGDLEPATIVAAYRGGLFPMPVGRHLAWWSPDPRGVIERLHVSRSLRRTRRRFEIRIDSDFAAVVDACAGSDRPGGWITPAIRRAYVRLHDLGWAHSVEAWSPDGALAGGVYGVAVGGLFAAESMFHRETDASKAALAALAERLGPRALLDVQWCTPHLSTLGAVEIARPEYLRRLAAALEAPPPRLQD